MLKQAIVLAFAATSLSAPLPAEQAGIDPALQAECAAIGRLKIADVAIESSSPQGPGVGWAAGMPAGGRMQPAAVSRGFCRVQGKIEGSIAFELWLPARAEWNGKFLGAGVGGAAGTFNYSDLPRGVSRGYAAATTDTGHKISDPAWMLDAAARDNYTHRANHLLAVKSKAIVQAAYGAAPKHSYFIGCSGGGRQGLKELQRYPADYDGILTGANGPRTPEMTTRRMWEILQRDANPNLMKAGDWQLIADAGRQSCDAADGVADGLVEDPRQCNFRIASLTCRPGQTGSCLSSEQVRFAERIYAPLRDEKGRAIDGGLLTGVLVDSGRSQLALGTFGQAIRGTRDWKGEGFSVARDLAAIDRVMPELRADSTDLSAFRRRGGKLIQYTGWLDGAVAARMVVDYHTALTRAAGGAKSAANFSRLYMLPDVHHCAGGPGPDQIGGSGRDAPVVDSRHDLLTALEQWVEQGRAPGEMVASKVEGGAVSRTHLICPFPKRAVYRGGPVGRAESFRCEAPKVRAS
ncbi:tannase/feruloyl esterase family alpha/beta hydrolase [Sphingomonas sp. M1-B02]|uniref:tannase/feruloyl esterase family alpha/beta hydrolase n=1 Tax=Sphingomonas sp. M1-B02 TaxID=3114300 RepID=UPI00223F4E70|nr:tannase/feruloyl esterase family alpha/beta hydrolase [Sphingomonas sp. S6-11]UZK65366.1 tannase/feruloyl esterase family alpha/beta hydrolase [Sphingomonas sp. S6-11]